MVLKFIIFSGKIFILFMHSAFGKCNKFAWHTAEKVFSRFLFVSRLKKLSAMDFPGFQTISQFKISFLGL